MQTRVTLFCFLLACTSLAPAQTPTQKIQWNIPLEYATQTDQVSNTQVLPRRQNTPKPEPQTPESSSEQETETQHQEDVTQAEARLNNEVRVLWDEIEKAEKQQQQKNQDIKVLPITPPKPTTDNKNNSKTKPIPKITSNQPKLTPSVDIKSEKERIEKLLNSSQNNKDSKNKDKEKDSKNNKNTTVNTNIKDKNNTDKNSKTDKTTTQNKKTTTTPVVIPPTISVQPKPVLTRKQVLEEEIAREKAALKSAQTQLLIAKKRGNSAQIIKLYSVIRDRELNVQAISRELSR